jgi:hypothetical protein
MVFRFTSTSHFLTFLKISINMKQLFSATGLLSLLITAICLLDSCKKQEDLSIDPAGFDSLRRTVLDTITSQKRQALDSVLGLLPIMPTPTIIPRPIPVGGSTDSTPDQFTYCKVQKYKWAPGNEEPMLLDPTADVIFPGSLLKAQSITDGTYIPIIVPRRPMLISTSLTNVKGSPKDTILDPARKSSAQEGLSRLLNRDLIGNFPAKMTKDVSRVYTEEQATLHVGADFNGWGAKVTAKFDWGNKKIKQRYLVKFYQEFFSVSVDMPAKPSDMFSSTPNPQLIGSYSPVYVSNVKYGRVVLFLWETESDSTGIEADLNASYSGLVAGGGVHVNAKFKSLMQKATMKVFAVGGDAEEGSKINSPETLQTFIEKGVKYSNANQGVPIAYSLRFLKNNSIAKVVQSSEYTVSNCEVTNGETHTIKQSQAPYEFGVEHIGGDKEFDGHGPHVYGSIKLEIRSNKEVWMKVFINFEETKDDWTRGLTNKEVKIYTVPDGYKLLKIESETEYTVDYVDRNKDIDIIDRGTLGLVKKFMSQGDAYGDDLPGRGPALDFNKSWVRLYLNDVDVSILKVR